MPIQITVRARSNWPQSIEGRSGPTWEQGHQVPRREELANGRKPAADLPLLLGNQLCFAVYSTAHAFNRAYKPLLERLGLTYPGIW